MFQATFSKLKSSLSGLTAFSWLLITALMIIAIFGISQLFQDDKKNQVTKNNANNNTVIQSIGDQAVEPIDRNAPISDTNPQAVKNELLVEITDKKYLAQFGNDIKPIKDFPDFYKLKVEGEGTLNEKQKTTESMPGVISAEPNNIVSAHKPATPGGAASFSRWQWGVNKIEAKKAWRVNKGGGVVVAVIDSGVRPDHIAFDNGIASGAQSYVSKGEQKIEGGGSCNNDGNWANDVDGHGTSVASIITAKGNYRVGKGGDIIKGTSKNFGYGNGLQMSGVAPNARIMPVQVLGCAGYGTWEWIARGVRHAAENGAHVINMSIGGEAASNGRCSAILERAVKYAIKNKNVSVVASSGNEKTAVSCPARIKGVIAVGAVDRFGNLTSNASWGSNYGEQQSVTAPGMHIASACACVGHKENNYYFMKFNGTSAAAPFVAGTAALIKGVNKYYTPEYVKKTIQKTANNPNYGDKSHHDNKYGYGIVNAYAAVLEAK